MHFQWSFWTSELGLAWEFSPVATVGSLEVVFSMVLAAEVEGSAGMAKTRVGIGAAGVEEAGPEEPVPPLLALEGRPKSMAAGGGEIPLSLFSL